MSHASVFYDLKQVFIQVLGYHLATAIVGWVQARAFVISLLGIEYATGFCDAAATVLAYYEYAITLADEVECIWRRKINLATILFVINRYSMLLARTLSVVHLLPVQTTALSHGQNLELCAGVLRGAQIFVVISQISIAVVLSLRMYAVWRCSYPIFAFVFVLTMVAPTLNIYFFTAYTPTTLFTLFAGCAEIELLSHNASRLLHLSLRIFNIIADAVLLVLTGMKTTGGAILMRNLGLTSTVTELMLRDGTIHFVVLFFVNLANIITTRFGLFGSGTLPAFGDLFVSIVISRFQLNLRELAYTSFLDQSSSSSSIGSVREVRFLSLPVGSLGAIESVIGEELRPKDEVEARLPQPDDETQDTVVSITLDEAVVIHDGDENGMYYVVNLNDLDYTKCPV